jgi:hypothetical protein
MQANRLQEPVLMVIGFVSLIFIGWALYAMISVILTFPSDVLNNIVTVTLPVIGALITVTVQNRYAKKKDIEQKQRNEKTSTYNNFLKEWFRVLREKDENKDLNLEFMYEFTGIIILWGSEETITEFREFRKVSRNSSSSRLDIMLQFEKVLRSMRKEMGSSNKDLGDGDLLRLFINDVDGMLSPSTSAEKIEGAENTEETESTPTPPTPEKKNPRRRGRSAGDE